MSNPDSTWHRVSDKGLYPPKMNWALLLPLRNLIFSPGKLIKRLGLQSNWNVLELGSGPGYFSPFIAKALPLGKLWVVDVQEEMVEQAQRRLAKYRVQNAEAGLTDGNILPYPSERFDCAFLVTVLGEIQNPSVMLRELHRTIRNGGLLSITELAGDPDALTVDQVRSLVEPAGFTFHRRFGKRRNFTVNFRKTR